jgi:hypothetical protein
MADVKLASHDFDAVEYAGLLNRRRELEDERRKVDRDIAKVDHEIDLRQAGLRGAVEWRKKNPWENS